MQKHDHTKLICDIGELSGLFADTPSLENFLQKIVSMISDHMQSEVCSIYLFYEEKNELILKATKGLHPDSVGKVKMKLGEGLTGLALKELRPICEKNASRSPSFKAFPGINEENYESFLAVPIVRGQTRIGAMVIQNTKKNYFSEDDVKALRAITSQLATTIETAKILMTLEEKKEKPQGAAVSQALKFVKGQSGSPGFAFSEAVVLESKTFLSSEILQKRYTLEDFYKAAEKTEAQLKDLQGEIEEKLSDVASLIFTAQILMLKDKAFVDAIVEFIQNNINPPQAVLAVVEKYVSMFRQISNSYMREKSHDVEDMGRRLLENLIGKTESFLPYKDHIIIARELFPSDILKLSSQGVKGAIVLSGGASSHLSILARSLQMPLVIADEPKLLNISQKTKVLLDAEVGTVYINPTTAIIASFKERDESRRDLSRWKELLKAPAETKDGVRIKLLSNINLLGDLKAARDLGAEGIGLYRTEFPFLVRSNFPSEEEQHIIYKKLVEGMPGKEITFRTLDIGGDKVLSYYNSEKEENPFLGMRSIRFSLRHKDIFAQQIRAILRAGVHADVKIMFPMISSLDEFLEARDVVLECARNLKKEKIPHMENIPVGMMVELPSVLEIIDDLAQEADFFSIGTNDFIQYMLAVDRTNEKVADLYLAHHPSILRALKKIVDAANTHQKDVSICGDMIHNEKFIPYFLGIGVRRISVDSRYIPKIKTALAVIDLKEAEQLTESLLLKNRVSEISEAIDGKSHRVPSVKKSLR